MADSVSTHDPEHHLQEPLPGPETQLTPSGSLKQFFTLWVAIIDLQVGMSPFLEGNYYLICLVLSI
jgi:hypothetical protein